jgi:hypothetical protein
MNREQLDAIEEAYETRIGPDASTVRLLVKSARTMLDELESIDYALAGGYVNEEDTRARCVADLFAALHA